MRILALGALLLTAGCDDAPAGTPDSGPPPVDQCVSSADRLILTGTTGDGGTSDAGMVDAGMADGGLPDPTVIGPACAYSCIAELLDEDPSVGRACMEACFEASPLGALTDGCRDCYIDGMYCTGYACPVECLGSDPSLCDACYAMYCAAPEASCTGL